jgi:hypothetical protein
MRVLRVTGAYSGVVRASTQLIWVLSSDEISVLLIINKMGNSWPRRTQVSCMKALTNPEEDQEQLIDA